MNESRSPYGISVDETLSGLGHVRVCLHHAVKDVKHAMSSTLCSPVLVLSETSYDDVTRQNAALI